MTGQEVKDWLKAISATQNQSIHKSSLSERKEALYMAMQAVDKQIVSKKISRESLEESYRCPSCNSERSWKDGIYCKDCGQKLEWQ